MVASCNVVPEKRVPDGTEIKSTNQTVLLYKKISIPVAGICKLHFKTLTTIRNKKVTLLL